MTKIEVEKALKFGVDWKKGRETMVDRFRAQAPVFRGRRGLPNKTPNLPNLSTQHPHCETVVAVVGHS